MGAGTGMGRPEDRNKKEARVMSSGRAPLQALGATRPLIGDLVAARDKKKGKGSRSSKAGMELSL